MRIEYTRKEGGRWIRNGVKAPSIADYMGGGYLRGNFKPFRPTAIKLGNVIYDRVLEGLGLCPVRFDHWADEGK